MGGLANGGGKQKPSFNPLVRPQHPALQEQLQPGAEPSTADPASPPPRIQPKGWARAGTSQEPLEEGPGPGRGLQGQPGSLHRAHSEPSPSKRSGARLGGPGYVMGFTGHQLGILLFTLLSLAKCKRFFPSTVER